jgi:hypothetical protein
MLAAGSAEGDAGGASTTATAGFFFFFPKNVAEEKMPLPNALLESEGESSACDHCPELNCPEVVVVGAGSSPSSCSTSSSAACTSSVVPAACVGGDVAGDVLSVDLRPHENSPRFAVAGGVGEEDFSAAAS